MTPFAIRLVFHGDLPFFLKSKTPGIERQLSERTSIKDVIEACGVPHTEVDLILVNGEPIDFAAMLTQDTVVDVYPPNQTRSPVSPEDRLQVRDIEKFVADGPWKTCPRPSAARDRRHLRFRGRRSTISDDVYQRRPCPPHPRPEPPDARCLRCNAALEPAKKAEVLDRLEPLTRIYYEQFRVAAAVARSIGRVRILTNCAPALKKSALRWLTDLKKAP